MSPMMIFLAPGSINHIANIVKGYAIAIGVVFAIYMVWQWWKTREREAVIDRTARARGVHARQLALALQNPELAEPMPGSLSSPAEVARYRMYVASLLTSADEILALDPTDTWQAVIRRQLNPHRSYLATPEFADTSLRDCTDELRRLVQSVASS